jgi:hypothetical protein
MARAAAGPIGEDYIITQNLRNGWKRARSSIAAHVAAHVAALHRRHTDARLTSNPGSSARPEEAM